MIELRQSTSVVVRFGPALLFSDGVTAVTNLVGTGSNQTEHTSTGILISKNGAAFAARSATATASVHRVNGHYAVTLSATDTNTLGVLSMQFANSAAFCPIWDDYAVITQNAWDAKYGATFLKVDIAQWLTATAPAFGTLIAGERTAIVAAIAAMVIEGTLTLQEAQKIQVAASAGKTDGFVPATIGTGHVRNTLDTKNRITAGYDANGNRTSISTDLT